MIVHCIIQIAVMGGGIPVLIEQPLDGKFLYEYVGYIEADYTESVKKFDLIGKPENYKDVIVKKDRCSK